MIQAVIFDLDGTVILNEDIWEEAFARVVSENNIDISRMMRQPNQWLHEPGIGLEPNWRRLVLDVARARELAEETRQLYMQMVDEEGDLPAPEDLVDILGLIKDRGWLTALSTGSSWNTVEQQLEELALTMAFDVTTTGEEIIAPKPDPEIYTLTAQKMNVEPEVCLVVEDAVAGVRAGREAGMKTAGIVSGYAPAKLLKDAGADWTVSRLGELKDILPQL